MLQYCSAGVAHLELMLSARTPLSPQDDCICNDDGVKELLQKGELVWLLTGISELVMVVTRKSFVCMSQCGRFVWSTMLNNVLFRDCRGVQ